MSQYWADMFQSVIIGAMMLLAVLGLGLAAVTPGMDRWSKRFFMCFFAVDALCTCTFFAYPFCYGVPERVSLMRAADLLGSVLPSIFVVMLAFYLLHCCGESWRESTLIRVVITLWTAFLILLGVAQFTDTFFTYAPDNQFQIGSLYPLLMAPIIGVLALSLVAVLRRRGKLSRRRFYAFLVNLIPLTAAIIAHVLSPNFALVYSGFTVSSLAMFAIVVSDQIEQYMTLQRETARQRAKIAVLQMRPHFIHNTMTSIYYLCDQDPKEAQRVTMEFNTYLRKNFSAIVKDETIPFSEELEHTRAYLAVEQAQFANKLAVDFDVPHTQFRVPPLTLQPLAENAVKHGMGPETVPLRISIKTRKAGPVSEIVVEDNGPGFDPAIADDPHTTLANIRQRLEMMCGGRLDFASREGGGTVVTISIP